MFPIVKVNGDEEREKGEKKKKKKRKRDSKTFKGDVAVFFFFLGR